MIIKNGLVHDAVNREPYLADIRFEEGIRRTIEYVLSHEECQVEDPEFDAWCDRVIENLEEAKKKIRQ